ncbi:MAG: NAD-dependent epimerase/dehydratase family protein [Ginsengibacter sp.]
MNKKTAVVIGATGLIGSYLVEELLKDDAFEIVRTLARRPLAMLHPKLQQRMVNFNDMNDYQEKFGEGDIIFCCIGTTQKNVKGDKALYERIDFDIPLNAAQIGVSKGFKKYLIVSSVGANENSSNFYLKLKGKTENALIQFAFESIGIFRPSMLLGYRKESRKGEKVVQRVMKFLSLFLFGSLKKYQAIDAKDVAIAMVEESKENNIGIHYFDYSRIMSLSDGLHLTEIA